MPHYNIKHKNKYYVFSSIVDDILYEFDTFEELQEYRLREYGKSNFDDEKTFEELKANKMEFKNTIFGMIIGGNATNDNITKYFMLLNETDKKEVLNEIINEYKANRMELIKKL